MRNFVMVFVMLASVVVFAFPEIPKASGKALGVTRGRKFDSGLVFINGKYLPPPYQVERWGTGLRINGQQVTGPIIDWTEFLKTQSGVKATRTETVSSTTVEPSPLPEPTVTSDDDDSSLDDLFDDDPKPKKKAKKAAWQKPVFKPRPITQVSYSLDGDFEPNEQSKALVNRINAVRTDVDKTLRSGGFIFFGDGYSRVSGDARTANRILDKLPELMHHAESAQQFSAAIRSAQLYYITDVIAEDIFSNRVDYRKLQDRRDKIRKDDAINQMLQGVDSTPLL